MQALGQAPGERDCGGKAGARGPAGPLDLGCEPQRPAPLAGEKIEKRGRGQVAGIFGFAPCALEGLRQIRATEEGCG